VVDDDPSFLRSVSRLLRVNGYDVLAYSSPADFLNSVPNGVPNWLIVDMHMPEITGVDVIERLASLGISLPSILVTAHDTAQTAQAAKRAGACGLLPKPFDGDVLLRMIRAYELSLDPNHLPPSAPSTLANPPIIRPRLTP
jgi:FixJ family two-component response regulator